MHKNLQKSSITQDNIVADLEILFQILSQALIQWQ